MSTLSKTLALLDFFGPDALRISADSVAERTGLSKATVYRHVKDLCDAGLLSRVGSGSYSLGPRIIELDWMMRQYDPILIAGRDLMQKLSEETRLAVFSSVFYDDRIINTHIVEPTESFAYYFGRGQPIPLFWGAQSRSSYPTRRPGAFIRSTSKKSLEIRTTHIISGRGATFPERPRKSGKMAIA